MVSEFWWLSDHEFEYHNLYLFDKNQTQDSEGLRKFQVQKIFTWGSVLEDNINHILKSNLIV